MQSLAYIPASNGAANASLMTVTNVRAANAGTILVNTVANVPAKFYASMGTPHTFTDPVTGETITVISETSAVDFAGSVSGGNINIDAIAPGYADTNGSKVGDIIVIRPNTEWANNIFNTLSQSLNDNGSLKASAYTYDPIIADCVQSGGIWAALTGFNASMTAMTLWQGGYQGTIAAIASRTFTASKDTYVDVSRTLTGYINTFTIVYTEVANGAAAPALAANSVRLAKVVTSASAVTSVTQSVIGQVQYDSLGNSIYPLYTIDRTNKVWIPDYGNQSATNLWSGVTTYTATQRGFIYFWLYSYNTSTTQQPYITINGKTVNMDVVEAAAANGARVAANTGILPVAPGDVIAYNAWNNANQATLNFIPGRWV